MVSIVLVDLAWKKSWSGGRSTEKGSKSDWSKREEDASSRSGASCRPSVSVFWDIEAMVGAAMGHAGFEVGGPNGSSMVAR